MFSNEQRMVNSKMNVTSGYKDEQREPLWAQYPLIKVIYRTLYVPNFKNTALTGLNDKVLVAQLCPALCNSMDGSPSGSSVHGNLQARILEYVAISFSRGPSRPRHRSRVSHVGERILYHLDHQGSTPLEHTEVWMPDPAVPAPQLIKSSVSFYQPSWERNVVPHWHSWPTESMNMINGSVTPLRSEVIGYTATVTKTTGYRNYSIQGSVNFL